MTSDLEPLRAQLTELRAERATLQEQHDMYAEVGSSLAKPFARTLRSTDVQITALKAQLAKYEKYAEEEKLIESPRGRLISAVADALQFDYLYGEDYQNVLDRMDEKLARNGLRVEVVPVDGVEL